MYYYLRFKRLQQTKISNQHLNSRKLRDSFVYRIYYIYMIISRQFLTKQTNQKGLFSHQFGFDYSISSLQFHYSKLVNKSFTVNDE